MSGLQRPLQLSDLWNLQAYGLYSQVVPQFLILRHLVGQRLRALHRRKKQAVRADSELSAVSFKVAQPFSRYLLFMCIFSHVYTENHYFNVHRKYTHT